MKLMTREIEKRAQGQYSQGADMDQMVVAKFFDPCGSWTWYLMNQDPEDQNYLWGIVKGLEIEVGSFALNELTTYKGKLGIGIERDLYFKPMVAKELLERLNQGDHI
jgi:hypothetical protein